MRERYDTSSYRQAVEYGIARAKAAGHDVPDWTPLQLRHAIATTVSQSIDQQAAQRWLGHKNLATTDIYVEQQVAELIAIARQIGDQFAG